MNLTIERVNLTTISYGVMKPYDFLALVTCVGNSHIWN